MKDKNIILTIPIAGMTLAALIGICLAQQNKDTVKVPNGLALSEFRDTRIGKASPPVIPIPRT